jgi:hypothetical protein
MTIKVEKYTDAPACMHRHMTTTKMETMCVNFISAPGVGKTMIAAHVFLDLKAHGHTMDWVGEYHQEACVSQVI